MNPWRFRADWLELSDLVLDIEAGRIEGSATPSQLLPEGSIVM